MDEEKAFGSEVLSDLVEGVRVGRVESRPEPMRQALEDEHNADSKKKEQPESGASMQVLQPASSHGCLSAGRMSGQVAYQSLGMIRVPHRCGFTRGK